MVRMRRAAGVVVAAVVAFTCCGCGVTEEEEPVRLDNGVLGTPPTPTVTVLPDDRNEDSSDEVPQPAPASPAPRPVPSSR
jgi:hypothetical protein